MSDYSTNLKINETVPEDMWPLLWM